VLYGEGKFKKAFFGSHQFLGGKLFGTLRFAKKFL
jgi:hypothetical protein